jgi:hypothetical protein
MIRELGDGLVLRRAKPADTERLVAFHSDIHRDAGEEEPNGWVGAWVRGLMERPHPTFRPGDFTLVEEAQTGKIVSSLCLISQAWSYGGVPFGVGRPELVGTHPDYRRRGLVRAQFEVVHEWSAQRGEVVQAVTGIPWYYRQFGYEMALALDGGRAGYGAQVPRLPAGEAEPYHLRPATEGDLPFLAEVYQQGMERSPVACVRDQALWRHELSGRAEMDVNRREWRVIETPAGEALGLLAHPPLLWQRRMGATAYEVKPGVSWLAVTPSVVRYLWATGLDYAAAGGEEMEAFAFFLGAEHPVYRVFQEGLPKVYRPYAWYLRLPDLAGFVWHVRSVLEARLAASWLAGHTGALHLSFYRSGLRLQFEAGNLVSVEPWTPSREQAGDAAFPDLTFLQMLFGYRSLEELRYAFADCWAAGDGPYLLLEALFPRRPSDVWPVS